MKKNDVILITAVIIYSILFYLQLAGINFLIFSIVLIALMLIKDHSLPKKNSWMILAAASLVSGVFVFMHGSTISIIANIVSLLLLSALSYNPKSSVIAAFIHSLYSEVSSLSFMIIDIIMKDRKKEKASKGNIWTRIMLIFIITAIILVMFILYRNANPLFYNFTKEINLDFISFHWLWFTFLGFVILYAFFYHRTFPAFQRFDSNTPGKLFQRDAEKSTNKGFRKFMGMETEWKAGITLLALLNILILTVNVIDINYLWIGKGLPEGLTMADALHQAVGTIILSIIIAIAVLLFIFRSDMNFYKKSKAIRVLAILWIIQNLFIVISTIYRNDLYIQEYTLTYKRIGVYVYLALTFAGLISAMIKVTMTKSNWYLFRFNGWSFYLALLILPSVNWDRFITKYNLEHSKETDMKYVFDLSYAGLPDLVKYSTENDLSKLTLPTVDVGDMRYYYSEGRNMPQNYKNMLDRKIYDFMEHSSDRDWRSWCLDRDQVKNQLIVLHRSGSITELDLKGCGLTTVEYLKEFQGISNLDLSENAFSDMNSLIYFSELKKLNLSANGLYEIDSLPEIKSVEELNLSRNNIAEFDSLKKLTGLTSLDVSGNKCDIKALPPFKNILKLNISENKISDLSFLNEMKTLQSLAASNIKINDLKTLVIPEALKELYLSGNNISGYDKMLFEKIGGLEKLEILDLSSNNIFALENLTRNGKEPLFDYSELKTLYISDNNMTNLNDINTFSSLEELYAAGNKIYSIDEMKKLDKIKALYISGNKISDIDALTDMKTLKTLNISDNPLTDYRMLGKLSGLEKLYAGKMNISELAFLKTMTNLTTLDLSENNISDISELKTMSKLEWLDISKNPVKDYSVLLGLKNLKTLYISNIDDAMLEKIKTALPEADIIINTTPTISSNEYVKDN
jgi:hypothetical protein